MTDPNLPAVPTSTHELVGTEGSAVVPMHAGVSSAPNGKGQRAGLGGAGFRLAGAGLVLLVTILVALGVASLVGEDVRRATMISLDRDPAGSEPSLTDSPEEAARFFAGRDTVTVQIPWDMSVAEFLGLYHLETNASARASLRDQLGATQDGDLLREGDEVSLTLTMTRPGG